MPAIDRFEDIHAWQTARDLTQIVYRYSNSGGFARDFGLKDQMRRAAVAIMSNIAEGYESHTRAQFVHYLTISRASAAELRSQAYVALDAGYINQSQFAHLQELTDKVIRQIGRFIAYLQR